MELLEEMFNQAVGIKESASTKTFKSDFIKIINYELHDNYLILPPTERNFEFARSIMKLYPETFIHTNVLDEDYRQAVKTYNILTNTVSKKNANVNAMINIIKNSAFIVEKTPEIAQYLDSLKVYSKLMAERFTPPIRSNPPSSRGIDLKGISHYLISKKLLPSTITDYKLKVYREGTTHSLTYEFDIDTEEFLNTNDLDKLMQFRDQLVDKAINITKQVFKTDATIERQKSKFYINGARYNDLSYKKRSLISKVNAQSGGWSKKVKGHNKSVFEVTVTFKDDFKSTRDFLIETISTISENRYLELFKKIINKG